MQYLLALTPADEDDCVFGEAIPNTTRRYRYGRSAFPQPLPALPMSREVAFGYMLECMCIDLRMRVSDARVYTFKSRMEAIGYLKNRFRSEPLSIDAWRHTRNVVLEPRAWSGEQQEFLD